MPQHRFEIVGRAFDRFTWRLVEPRGSRRLVLARTDQDYSTLQKVEEAIAEFQVIVKDAKVVNTTLPGETPVQRLPTRFKFEDVAPLVVEKSPDEDDELAEGPPAPTRKEPDQPAAAQAAQAAAAQAAAAQAAAAQAAAAQAAAAQAAQAAQPAQPAQAAQAAADQPAADQPAADQPAADQPAADQPAADQAARSTRRPRQRVETKASATTRERTAPSSGSRRKKT